MDEKTSHKADEPSSMHLSAIASKAQAQGTSTEAVLANSDETASDAASRTNRNRRHQPVQ